MVGGTADLQRSAIMISKDCCHVRVELLANFLVRKKWIALFG
jgi:hypothetical protein